MKLRRRCQAPSPEWPSRRSQASGPGYGFHNARRARSIPASSISSWSELLHRAGSGCRTGATPPAAPLPAPYRRRGSPPPVAPDGSSTLPAAGLFRSCGGTAPSSTFAILAPSAQRCSLGLHAIDHQIDGVGKPFPAFFLLFQPCPACGGERVELGRTAGLTLTPFGANPALLLQPVQGGIKRSLLHLQHLVRNLLDALGDRPAMLGFERERLQDQQVQSSLYQIVWFAHSMIIYNRIVDGQGITSLRLVGAGKG